MIPRLRWQTMSRLLPYPLRKIGAPPPGASPIALFSLNRPHYLAEVLKSFAAQPGLAPERLHLFQDGAVNAYSGRVAADQKDIDTCIALFRRHFPGGRVHASPVNIGVDENFIRAERFVFEELGAECAYFFEDDLVFLPAYLTVMERLYAAVWDEPRIGYFAAYGDHMVSLDRQRAAPTALRTLGHHWGFGLKRAHWQAMQPLLRPYYQLVVGGDFEKIPHRAVRTALRWNEMAPANGGQDNVRAFVTTRLGVARINTVVCFGRYIGETGLHFTPKRFVEMGFHQTELYDGPTPTAFACPTRAEIDHHVGQMAAIFAESSRTLGP